MATQILWMKYAVLCLFARGLLSQTTSLNHTPASVFENESVIIFLIKSANATYGHVFVVNGDQGNGSLVLFGNETCTVYGFLNNDYFYNVSCNSTTVSIKINNVKEQMHGDVWSTRVNGKLFETTIHVKVRVRKVDIETWPLEDENNRITVNESDAIIVTCLSSHSRPNVTVNLVLFNISKTYITVSNEEHSYHKESGLLQTNSTFQIKSNRLLNGLEMLCNATNDPGKEVQSKKITLNILFPPSNKPFIANHTSGLEYSIIENNTGLMICLIDKSNPPANLSWECTKHEDINVTSLDETSLSVQWTALRNKTTVCNCTSTHILSKPTSVSVNVNVLYPPQFIKVDLKTNNTLQKNIDSNISVIENKNISLICSADGNPKASNYTWSGIAYSSSLELILTTNKSVNGVVSCKASNEMKEEPANKSKFGTVMKSYFIHVLYSALILPLPNASVIEGRLFKILCEVIQGNSGNETVKWTTTGDVDPSNNHMLIISNVSRRHNGEHTCSANSTMSPTYGPVEFKYERKSFFLDVMYPPENISVNLKMVSLNVGSVNTLFSIVRNASDQIVLNCSASGHPSPYTYKWYGDQVNDSSTLFVAVSNVSRGSFTCIAVNTMTETGGYSALGQTNKTFIVDILYPPEIFPLNDQKVIEGEDFNISCLIKPGNPENYRFTWINGANATVQNESTLTVMEAGRNKNGNYTCELSYVLRPTYGNNITGVIRKTFNLNVLYPPENITVSLHMGHINQLNVSRNFSVIENGSLVITLNCSASGNPSPDTYRWSGRQKSSNSTISFNVRRDLGGIYACYAENKLEDKYGTTKDSNINETFNVNILYPPEIEDMSNTTAEAEEGNPYNIRCNVIPGNETQHHLFWFKNEGNFQTNTSYLTFSNITRNDSGIYTCNMTYTLAPTYGGTVTYVKVKSFTINVLYHADVSMFYIADNQENMSVTVNENEPVKMICQVDSNPGSTIEMFMNGVLVSYKTEQKKLDHVIQNCTCNHTGKYTCYGFNLLNNGVKSMKSLHLFVTCSPRPLHFMLPVENISSVQHVPVTFSLNIMAYPKPNFNFYRLNGTTLIAISNGVIENQTIVSPAISQINITLEKVTESHFGQYILNVSNSFGYYQQRFQLIPKELVQISQAPSIAGAIAGGAVSGGVLAICVIIAIVFIIHKRRLNGPVNKYLDEANSHVYQNMKITQENKKEKRLPPLPPPEEDVAVQISSQEMVNAFKQQDDPTYLNTMELTNIIKKISVPELFTYVSSKPLDQFLEEFEKFPKGMIESIPYTVARQPENAALNRYQGLYPYDHSRVVIESRPEVYINANFIDGFEKRRTYIASLGPTVKHTVGFTTFWNMVWYEKSDVIVMLTNLSEPSGMKCEKYWAENGKSREIGDFTIQSLGEEIAAEYTVRTLTAYKGEESRMVTQLHYTAWPDKKVPEDVTSLIEFMHRVKAAPTRLLGPVVVHCSAGIGRTGTYIALDRLIEEGRATNAVNVYDCVMNMRKQRVNMVQTSDQYFYLHQALVYCLVFDIEPITADEIDEYIQTTSNNVYSILFQQLQQTVEEDASDEKDAREVNGDLVEKNRRRADIPGNTHRIRLFLDKEMGESDYINAVNVNGFKRLDHYILAQSPLTKTLDDFVTMLYQENCCCIVALDDYLHHGTNNATYLPPENQRVNYGNFTVSCTILESKPSYSVRKLKIGHCGQIEKGEKVAYHFEFIGWKHDKTIPEDPTLFVDFVREVDEYATQLADEHAHVLVHCMTGSERSGLFCAVSNMIEKMGQERQVSIVNILRQVRARRKTAIPNMEQLKFCYHAVNAFVKSYNI